MFSHSGCTPNSGKRGLDEVIMIRNKVCREAPFKHVENIFSHGKQKAETTDRLSCMAIDVRSGATLSTLRFFHDHFCR